MGIKGTCRPDDKHLQLLNYSSHFWNSKITKIHKTLKIHSDKRSPFNTRFLLLLISFSPFYYITSRLLNTPSVSQFFQFPTSPTPLRNYTPLPSPLKLGFIVPPLCRHKLLPALCIYTLGALRRGLCCPVKRSGDPALLVRRYLYGVSLQLKRGL